MIIYMFKIICVTNRKLCNEDFLDRIKKVLENKKPDYIILREKDLTEEDYEKLANSVKELCEKNDVRLILHSFHKVASRLGVNYVHFPLGVLRGIEKSELENLKYGASIHSLDELKEAVDLGVSYVTAGHVFLTDCKKGLPARGLDFLKEICDNSSVPVFGIGGINMENIDEIKETHAAGACIMSGFMRD